MEHSVVQAKKELRRRALAARRALTPAYRESASQQMVARLCETEAFQAAKTVFLYASMPDEVQTYGLMQQCLALGKTVALPKITGKRAMEAVAFSSLSDLVPGAYDILTVKDDAGRLLPAKDIDLIIVPGAAFDAQGHRLGHGAGFYDIFMSEKAPQALCIALTFDILVYDEVPTEPHDECVDRLITESRDILCWREKG